MDKQAFIQSGIIEAYVLGLSTTEENLQVEELSDQHPEISQAIEDFSTSIEKELNANAIIPPQSVKHNLMNALQDEFKPVQQKNAPLTVASKNEFPDNAIVKNIFPWKMAAAASVILLLVSAAFNFHYYGKYTTAKTENENLMADRNTLQANIQVYKTSITQFESATAMMADPDMIMVKMGGQGSNENSMATVFWDSKTKEVYLMPNKLPAPIAGKQYQLWALVDGKPVDAGLMDANCIGVCKLKNISEADAFAITLEAQGGSPTPTLSQLFVLGKV